MTPTDTYERSLKEQHDIVKAYIDSVALYKLPLNEIEKWYNDDGKVYSRLNPNLPSMV